MRNANWVTVQTNTNNKESNTLHKYQNHKLIISHMSLISRISDSNLSYNDIQAVRNKS